MGKIQQLPEELVNKIAAGEVIERPASVVKELVENALDAGASRIAVEIKGGGRTLITVADNGSGMAAEDVPLAFSRHATSKIHSLEDLFQIKTMGFRGEALPSVAAVSRLKLLTRRAEDVAGTEIHIEGGKVLSIGPVGTPVGTRVEVRDLFFNTPARAKFLKTVATESGRISDLVTGLALANPAVQFTLNQEGRQLLQTPGTGKLLECIHALYGREMVEACHLAVAEGPGLEVRGYVAGPAMAKSNRRHQFLFVNGRLVSSRLLASAVEKAFHTYLQLHQYPVFFLALTIEPSLIDVNVHPTKSEVRFSREQDVYRAVLQAAAGALRHLAPPSLLGDTSSSRETTATLKEPGGPTPQRRQEGSREPEVGQRETTLLASGEGWREGGRRQLDLARLVECVSEEESPLGSFQEERTTLAGEVYSKQEMGKEKGEPPEDGAETAVAAAPGAWLARLSVVGQVHSMYILATDAQGFYIFDQHAVHERILYEELQQALAHPEQARQPLLFPVTLDLSPRAAAMRAQLLPELEALGFAVEEFGQRSLLVRALPVASKEDPLPMLREVIEVLLEEEGSARTVRQRQAHALARVACHAAVKAGEALPLQVQAHLLLRLSRCAVPQTCPHGRPTMLSLTWAELARRFARTQRDKGLKEGEEK